MDLRHSNTKEPVAAEICIRLVDAGDGIIAKLIKDKFNISLRPRLRWKASGQLGISCQKPLHHALERDEALVQQWLKQEYPKIKALARREKADIYFGDAAHMRSDHHTGRTLRQEGRDPIVLSTGAGYRMSLISAVTSRGYMRFMIKEKGGVNSDVFSAARLVSSPSFLQEPSDGEALTSDPARLAPK
jgi:hypothetical protein